MQSLTIKISKADADALAKLLETSVECQDLNPNQRFIAKKLYNALVKQIGIKSNNPNFNIWTIKND